MLLNGRMPTAKLSSSTASISRRPGLFTSTVFSLLSVYPDVSPAWQALGARFLLSVATRISATIT